MNGQCTMKILIIDGSPAAAQEALVKRGGHRHGANYAASLQSVVPDGAPEPEFFILAAADGEQLPQGMTLADFDGIAWTGSPSSAYDGSPEVNAQIDLARDAYHTGVPCFGSCWGLQIMCAALGGRVHANPNGYEVGIARAITLNDEGRAHKMYDGKASMFDAIATHYDEVAELPANAVLLASNDMSRVQAIEIADGDKLFWGVQYHPEYDLRQIAAILRRRAGAMVKDGFADKPEDIEAMASHLMQLSEDPSRRDIAWKYGIGPSVLDHTIHRREFTNWLEACVMPKAAVRVGKA
jgi:GMP synthase (glutamine-hydrolysing)